MTEKYYKGANAPL